MSLLPIRPASGSVTADSAGRPRQVMLSGRPVAVSAIESVREEVAAYPVATGPRTLFVVLVEGTRLRLVHEHRARRWTVEVIGSGGLALPTAA